MRPGPAVLAFVIAALAACSCGRPAADASWESEVQAVLDAQAAAWNRGDIAGYMAGYWRSDSLLFTSGGSTRRGWRETFEKYSASYDTREKMGRLSFLGLEFHELGPDAAWIFGRWELERAADRPGGLFTLVVRRFPDGWKIVHDHTSSDPEPSPPVPAP